MEEFDRWLLAPFFKRKGREGKRRKGKGLS